MKQWKVCFNQTLKSQALCIYTLIPTKCSMMTCVTPKILPEYKLLTKVRNILIYKCFYHSTSCFEHPWPGLVVHLDAWISIILTIYWIIIMMIVILLKCWPIYWMTEKSFSPNCTRSIKSLISLRIDTFPKVFKHNYSKTIQQMSIHEDIDDWF